MMARVRVIVNNRLRYILCNGNTPMNPAAYKFTRCAVPYQKPSQRQNYLSFKYFRKKSVCQSRQKTKSLVYKIPSYWRVHASIKITLNKIKFCICWSKYCCCIYKVSSSTPSLLSMFHNSLLCSEQRKKGRR